MKDIDVVKKIEKALADVDFMEETFMKPYMVAASRSVGGKRVNVYHEGVRAVLRAVLEA